MLFVGNVVFGNINTNHVRLKLNGSRDDNKRSLSSNGWKKHWSLQNNFSYPWVDWVPEFTPGWCVVCVVQCSVFLVVFVDLCCTFPLGHCIIFPLWFTASDNLLCYLQAFHTMICMHENGVIRLLEIIQSFVAIHWLTII